MSQVVDRASKVVEVAVTDSSVVKKVEYSHVDEMLDVTFPNGNVYRYKHVPLDVWLSLCWSPDPSHSMGRFYNKYIRNVYASTKIRQGTDDS